MEAVLSRDTPTGGGRAGDLLVMRGEGMLLKTRLHIFCIFIDGGKLVT